ncbi:MAG: thiol:disulfide interchange protein DsbA/DsbL [Caldimonas sp.]
MKRRDFSTALVASGAVASLLGAQAASAETFTPVESRDYTKIEPPQPTSSPGKIEVLEFFSYGCPHCSAFEPILEAWAHGLPADVVLKRVPVPFLFNADNFAHTYYALETTGLVDKMQMKIFSAVHVDRLRLDKPEDIAALVAKNGGDGAKFLAAFKSFSVATSVARSKKMTADYKIDGVPSLTIQGRFLTSPALATSEAKSLLVADALIQRSRKG